MGGPHGRTLHVAGASAVHRLPAHLKVVALLVFVGAVVATPREAFWAYGLHVLVLLVAIVISTVPFRVLLPRLVIELPFVVFALLMPFVAVGPQTQVGPLALSVPGLWGAWALLAKGTLGALASLLLAATTSPTELVGGLARLRLPRRLVEILAFMIRYLDVVTGELRRMRIARESRGFAGRSLAAWPVIAGSAGALFIRSFERGERVHLAMLSRRYTGDLHLGAGAAASEVIWVRALALPSVTVLVAAVALGMGAWA
ncbi:cobalt ECF transporter T component CbiQ [Janibacter alittae]|uniref:Cobalt ECF transporter T component CbiQ n=1 Tax=Janibacter alittae TaxID=3115209 RepID=A0ABZ2MEM5_9MICO